MGGILATMEIFQLDHGIGTQNAQERLDWFAGSATKRVGDDIISYRDYLSTDLESSLREKIMRAMRNLCSVDYYWYIHEYEASKVVEL